MLQVLPVSMQHSVTKNPDDVVLRRAPPSSFANAAHVHDHRRYVFAPLLFTSLMRRTCFHLVSHSVQVSPFALSTSPAPSPALLPLLPYQPPIPLLSASTSCFVTNIPAPASPNSSASTRSLTLALSHSPSPFVQNTRRIPAQCM